MQIKTNYIIASTFSFLIHASLILFFVGYFYSEKKVRPVLNNPIDVSLIFEQDAKKLFEIIKEIGASESNSEAKKLISNKAVKVNSQLIEDINHYFKKENNQNQKIELSIGKKKFYQISFK